MKYKHHIEKAHRKSMDTEKQNPRLARYIFFSKITFFSFLIPILGIMLLLVEILLLPADLSKQEFQAIHLVGVFKELFIGLSILVVPFLFIFSFILFFLVFKHYDFKLKAIQENIKKLFFLITSIGLSLCLILSLFF